MDNDEVRVLWRAQKEREYYGVETFYVIPTTNAIVFNVTYSVERRGSNNMVTNYVNNFIEIIGYNPVKLSFNRTDGTQYERID